MWEYQEHPPTSEETVLQIKIRIPRNDPRFAGMLAELDRVRGQRGKASPLPRMVMEWALIGRMLVNGELHQDPQ